MKKDDISNARSLQLQEEYIAQHGMAGKTQPKSSKDSASINKTLKSLFPYFDIYPDQKLMYKTKDYPSDIQKCVDELIQEYGYSLQTIVE